MAHKSFSYKGYDIYMAALQPSKARLGGTERSLQVRKDSIIKKNIRFKTGDVYGFAKASKIATDWIDQKLKNDE